MADQETWKAEAQYTRSGEFADAVFGVSYFDGQVSTVLVIPPFEFPFPSEPDHINAYGYLQFATRPGMPLVQVGLSYDDLSSQFGNQSELNPKLGIFWSPTESISFRAAAFRVLKRNIGSDQGLEPTQLAGFNQFFDDSNGSVSEGAGLAADFTFSDSVSAGIQLTRRNLEAPFLFQDGSTVFQSQREDTAGGHLYWLPSEHISLAFEPRYQNFEFGVNFDRMRLTELPVSLRYFSPTGWRLGLTTTMVDQDGEFDGPLAVEAGSNSFVLVDAIVSYRLPRRMGTISLEGTNLLDEEFQFQEIDQDFFSPRYVPEMQVRLRLSLSF